MNMNEIIREVARRHNTTPEKVYAEMQIAIDAALMNKDPEIQKEWAKVPFSGERPAPEDVIIYLADKLNKLRNTVS